MQHSIFKTWSFLFFLLIGGSVVSAQGSRTPKTPRSANSNTSFMSIDTDSSVHPAQTFVTYRDRDLYVMTLEQDRLLQLYVNGRQVPADSFSVYQPLVVKVREQMKRDRLQAERDREQAFRDREQAGRDKEQAERDQEQAGRDKRQADKDAEQAVRDKRAAEQDAQQAGRDKLQAERDSEQGDKDKQQAEKDRLQAGRDRDQADRDKEQAGRDREQAGRDREQAERDRDQAKRDSVHAEEDKAMIKSLIAEAVKQGLAPDEKSVRSVELDEDALYINGKKQPEEIHAKFKAKFMKSGDIRISFHNGSLEYYSHSL